MLNQSRLAGVLLLSACCASIAASRTQVASAPVTATPHPTAPVDLNTASRAQLLALPGMGPVYVDRIVDGRPYTAKNQLTQRGILPVAAYLRLRDLVVAHRVR